MKKIITHLAIIIFLTVSVKVLAKQPKLYFIESHSGTQSLLNRGSTLYQLNNVNQLKRVRGITTWAQSTTFVRPYYDQKVTIIGSVNNRGYFHIDILDMNNPDIERSVELQLCKGCAYSESYLYVKDGKNGFLATKVSTKHNQSTLELYGIEFSSKKNTELNHSILGDVLSFGWSNGNFKGDHLPHLYFYDDKPVYSGLFKIDLGWQLPAGLKQNDGDRFIQLVNNKNLRVIITYDSYNSNTQNYFAFDKRSNQWHSFELNNKGGFKGFGYWLTTEHQSTQFSRNEELTKVLKRNLENRTEQKRHYLSRFKAWNIDKTGLLHIINPIKKIHIKFDTKHPDSEVLLIENNQVIYRVADQIYSAKINDKQLVEHQLLVQSDIVTAIHWAFYGSE